MKKYQKRLTQTLLVTGTITMSLIQSVNDHLFGETYSGIVSKV